MDSYKAPLQFHGLANPLPAANIRRPLCFRRREEICYPLASSELGSPAAVAEGGRWGVLAKTKQNELFIIKYPMAPRP